MKYYKINHLLSILVKREEIHDIPQKNSPIGAVLFIKANENYISSGNDEFSISALTLSNSS